MLSCSSKVKQYSQQRMQRVVRYFGVLSVVSLALFHDFVGLLCAEDVQLQIKRLQAQSDASQISRQIHDRLSLSGKSADAASVYQILRSTQSIETLMNLACDQNANTALHAAWELYNRGDTNEASYLRFIGFVEGRLRVQLPDDWRRDLLHQYNSPATLATESQIDCLELKAPAPESSPHHLTSIRLHSNSKNHQSLPLIAPKGTQLTRDGDWVDIRTASGHIKIADANLDKVFTQFPHVRYCIAEICPSHSIVGLYGSAGEAFPLMMFDTRSGRMRWQQTVWAFGTDNLQFVSGGWWHRISLQWSDNSLTVFGSGSSCYIESFEVKSGKPTIRFSTAHWTCH